MHIVTGDDAELTAILRKNEQRFNIDAGAIVKASITNRQDKTTGSTVFIPPVTQSNTAAGADWSTSQVVIEFSSIDTALITRFGELTLEIQVDDDKKRTWFLPVTVEEGTIA